MAQLGSVLGDGEDPRLQLHEKYDKAVDSAAYGVVKPQHRKLHDATITFEEYYYYAQQTRLEEEKNPTHDRERGLVSLIFPSKSDGGVERVEGEKDVLQMNLATQEARMTITDDEWANASRALRTATRGAVFYLITTDILGPFGLPFAFATMGWG